jgi:hypothetical protein
VDIFVFLYENRRMKPVEIVLRSKREEEKGRGTMIDYVYPVTVSI